MMSHQSRESRGVVIAFYWYNFGEKILKITYWYNRSKISDLGGVVIAFYWYFGGEKIKKITYWYNSRMTHTMNHRQLKSTRMTQNKLETY